MQDTLNEIPKYKIDDKAYMVSKSGITEIIIYGTKTVIETWRNGKSIKHYYKTEYYHWVVCDTLEDDIVDTMELAKEKFLKLNNIG